MMTTFKPKAIFQYSVNIWNGPDIVNDYIITPPFASAQDVFWQLKFNPNHNIAGEGICCSLTLWAIPSPLEKKNLEWSKDRESSCSILFIEDKKMTYEAEVNLNILGSMGVTAYNKRASGVYTRKDTLKDPVTFGIRFQDFKSLTTQHTSSLWRQPLPENLHNALEKQFERSDMSDIRFIVNGKNFFASSTIISQRSSYFKSIFSSQWTEDTNNNYKDVTSINKTRPEPTFFSPIINDNRFLSKSSQWTDNYKDVTSNKIRPGPTFYSSTINDNRFLPKSSQWTDTNNNNYKNVTNINKTRKGPTFYSSSFNDNRFLPKSGTVELKNQYYNNNSSPFKYTIRIQDFHPETFRELLRYFYTNEVIFNIETESDPSSTILSPSSPFNILLIADKYLVNDLCEIAKAEIIRTLTIENSTIILFNSAGKWPDLKEKVLEFFIKNFSKIKETSGFEYVIDNYSMFSSNFGDIMKEIMKLMKPKKYERT